MSLKNIHLLFISLSTALSIFFGSWCVWIYRDGAGLGYLAGGILSFAAAFALALYGNWFVRKMRRLPTERTLRAVFGVVAGTAVWTSLAASTAQACQTCFGDPNSPITKSAEMGVWFLLAVILLVQAAFGIFFFVYLRRRARAFRDPMPRPFLRLVKNS
ncbi:MAG: hypothetical protein ACRD2A_08215 [Vicinamibacterales bacterium]